MAINTKNDVGPSGEVEAPSKVTVSANTPVPRRFHRPKLPHARKKTLLAALLIVILVVVGSIFIASRLHIGQKVYAQAAGHKIYKQDVENLIGNSKGISDHDAATSLADKYLTEAMAKDAKVTVTDQDLVSAYGKDINTQKTQQKYYYQLKVNQLYLRKLGAYNTGIYKGEYLIADFDRNIPTPSPLLAEDEAANPHLGNSKDIAADKKYASDFITKLYNQIMTHKMTFAQAIKAEHDDPEVGIKAYPTVLHSGSFDTSSGYGSVLTAQVTNEKIKSIKAGTMTKPFLANTSNGQAQGTAGSYYLVVRMDESRGGLNVPFSQYLQQAKQKYGYKVNV